MHELAIAESVVAAVLDRAAEQEIRVVHVRVGQLCGVVPDSLLFCFDLAAAGTGLEGARLEIERVPGVAHCRTCGADFTMVDAFRSATAAALRSPYLAGKSSISLRWRSSDVQHLRLR